MHFIITQKNRNNFHKELQKNAETCSMPKNSYEKPDFWSQKAFKEGYPARSVYKLQEIDAKFGFIKKNYTYE